MTKRLSRPEIKQVARCVLEALRVLHRDGMVHTGSPSPQPRPPRPLLNPSDVKLDNIFVNHGQGGRRFSEVQLGDCGGVVSQESSFAREGHLIGAGFTRSPEATFQLPWTTATDIWSFGTAVRQPQPTVMPLPPLICSRCSAYCLAVATTYSTRGSKGVGPKDDAYEMTIMKRIHKFFGRIRGHTANSTIRTQ